jgi:hypothetical protein
VGGLLEGLNAHSDNRKVSGGFLGRTPPLLAAIFNGMVETEISSRSISCNKRVCCQTVRSLTPVSHAFWTIPLLVAGALLPIHTKEKRLIDSIAWTNLYKVTAIGETTQRGPPAVAYRVPKSRPCLKPGEKCNCIDCTSTRWLVKEIEILKPHVVLVGLGRIWKNVARCLQLSETPKFPSSLTAMLRRKIPQNENLKSAWLTYHFSQWGQACEHGTIVFRIRKALTQWETASTRSCESVYSKSAGVCSQRLGA